MLPPLIEKRDPAPSSAEWRAAEEFLAQPCEATFGPVFRAYAPRLLRYFELRGCGRELAEDLTQDTLLAAYRQASSVRDPARFRAYVYAIGRNTHLMHLRRAGRVLGERVELEGLRETLPCSALDPLSRSVLYESLERLEPVSRRILALRYLDGLEYHEIAEVLSLPLGTVQWKVFDGKKRLAQWLAGRSGAL